MNCALCRQKTGFFKKHLMHLTFQYGNCCGPFNGGCLVFAKPNGYKDAHYLIDLIRRESITILSFVPSMLSAFTEALQAQVLTHDRPLPSLKHLFCGGEALKWGQAKKWHDL